MGKNDEPETLSPEQLDALLLEIQQGTIRNVMIKEPYVIISDDRLEAWLYLTESKDGSSYTKADLIEILKAHGVKAGFLESNLAAMAKKKIYEREIIVAKGIDPKPGIPGRYEYFFDPPNYKAAPKIREDGSVDYMSMSSLPNVDVNCKLAEYFPAIPGEDGYDVTGVVIRAQAVRDLPPLRGKGITNSENQNIYMSKVAGKIEMKDNNIDIQPIHEIKGDVDMIIGRIEFYGDVIISGSVEAGVIVRAGRNVVIGGTVGPATIYAGGDIILKRGISGGNKAKVIAKGSVMADFIENAEIDATGSVHANTILNSKVMSKDFITVAGKRGIICGGYTHGLTGVKATNLGNDIEIKTIVHAGFEAGVYERFVYLTRRESELKKELSDIVEEMAEILKAKRLKGSINPIEEKNLLLFNKKKDENFILLDSARQERDKLGLEINKGRGAKIQVEGNINRGVVIAVENAMQHVERSTVYMEYTCSMGQIQGNVIIYK